MNNAIGNRVNAQVGIFMKRTFQGFSIAVILSIVLLLPVVLAEGVDCPAESWVEAKPAQVPGVRICGMMVYDSESDVVLQYGGFNGAEGTGEMWAYDYETNTWENKTPLISPAPRYGQGFIYDESRDRCMMFFGTDVGGVYYNDTWEYDYNSNTWTELSPENSPSPRCKGGSTYDIESDQVIFFGGYGPDEINLAETWTFNYDDNKWINRTSDVKPSPRKRNPIMYDEANDVTIMFGGWLGGEEVLGDTWAYDFNSNTWENMTPSSPPAPRARYGRAYLPDIEGVMIMHGYGGSVGDFNDTWIYDYKENTWTEIEYTGPAAQRRHCFQVALDRESGVIVVQGGTTPGLGNFEDTWILNPYPEEEDGSGTIMTILIILTIIVVLIAIIGIVLIRSSKAD